MKDWIGIMPALLVAVPAAVLLVRRTVRFIRTRGRSGCDNCPWKGSSDCSCRRRR